MTDKKLTGLSACLLTSIALLMSGTAWPQLEQQAYIKASNSDEGARFGRALAMDGDTLVVGAMLEKSAATGVNGNQTDTSLWDAGAVYVFTRNGKDWEQQAYIKASNTDANDNFGNSVDISGDTLVVGASGEDSAASGVNGDQENNQAPDAGAAYVFVREGDNWRQQAYLKASNPDNPDRFGHSVAVFGKTIIVGAPQEASNAQGINGDQNDNSTRNAGAAYIFTRQGEIWTQVAYLKASNTDSMNFDYAQDFFGYSVDIHDDTIVVGAYGEDSAATGVNSDEQDESASFSGAVYIFVRKAVGWIQQAYIKASNTGSSDGFGRSVSIHHDQLVVGAYGEKSSGHGVNADQTDDSSNFAGAAYVFVRNSENWIQDAYLKASNSRSWDYFGESVDIFGNTVLVGAWSEDSKATDINGQQGDDSFDDAGAVYLYRKKGGVWQQDAYIKASNTGRGDLFGQSVAIDRETLAVGAQLEGSDADGIDGDQSDDSVRGAGAVYVLVDPTLNVVSPINLGHSGAWYNPNTPGQGQLIDIEPESQFIFLSWFTFTDGASSNPNEQHWFTAQGNYSDDSADLTVYETLGGRFDDPQAVTTEPVGTATLNFSDCGTGQLDYVIDTWDLQGSIPLLRAIPDTENVCEELAGNTTGTLQPNDGRDGAWFDEATPGQGFLIDAHPNPDGDDFIFVAWFTYGEGTSSGQRWLTAQGPLEGSVADIVVYETLGGRFDDSQPSRTNAVGTMTIDFTDCSNAVLSYSITDETLSGMIDIKRAISGTEALCQELTGSE